MTLILASYWSIFIHAVIVTTLMCNQNHVSKTQLVLIFMRADDNDNDNDNDDVIKTKDHYHNLFCSCGLLRLTFIAASFEVCFI